MTRVFITGIGAVSPAGWGTRPLMEALSENREIPTQPLPGGIARREARVVPAPTTRTGALSHPRLRRASGISTFAMAAAEEALSANRNPIRRLGIVVASHVACVRYTERFFAEALRDPASASPLLFPETVVNAPASHLAAALGPAALTYSIIGDQTAFYQAVAIGALWLAQDRVDEALIIGAEECGWNVATAINLFSKNAIYAEGAGALLLAREPRPTGVSVELESISDPQIFTGRQRTSHEDARPEANPPPADIICDSSSGCSRWDPPPSARPTPQPHYSPRRTLGEALAAGTAWQFVVATSALMNHEAPAATLITVGSNHQSISARLLRRE